MIIINKKGYERHKTKKKFMLDGKMVNFTFQGMVFGEKSKDARKKGLKRTNHYGRFEEEEGSNSYYVFIRKK